MVASALSVFAMVFSQARLTERPLADIAVIGVPRSVKEMDKGIRDDQPGRLTFTFASSYFWASFGSGTAYKQQLFVSIMAPDATDAQYQELPTHYSASYDHRKTVRQTPLGSGSLTVTEGVYRQNSLQEPAYTFLYADRSRRLQITWHTVKTEVDLATGTEAIGKMAASFRIVRDPANEFAKMRDRPRKEAETKASRRATAIEMLTREGYTPLQPGKPVVANGAYVEWMNEPEPRFQLLVPLGRVRGSGADASRASRPRPVRLDAAGATSKPWPGSIGWREYVDDRWELSNRDDAYLPFPGIAAALAATETDRTFTYFYYAATVRVELEDGDRLTNLRWFFDSIPEVQRLWREGKLVTGGTPERD